PFHKGGLWAENTCDERKNPIFKSVFCAAYYVNGPSFYRPQKPSPGGEGGRRSLTDEVEKILPIHKGGFFIYMQSCVSQSENIIP
ncbi:MAG: hypothetical protein IJN44_04820, partial [Clostridia bacterium]|nr:hypothetical protein [Clostridia bacterium]